MGRNGLITLSDIEGHLTTLRVECDKCGRKGRYNVAKLIAKHGREETIHAIVDPLNDDCPLKKNTLTDVYNACRRMCPDLSKLPHAPRSQADEDADNRRWESWRKMGRNT